jgi:four helix bundle protein
VKIKSFTELTVWQRAHELALLIFRITEQFPRADQFGIVSQVRRSCSSVTANIAEGYGRGTTKELLRSLQISRGELEETRCFMRLSRDLGRIKQGDFEQVNALCDSVGQLINALGRTLKGRLSGAGVHESRITSHESRRTN